MFQIQMYSSHKKHINTHKYINLSATRHEQELKIVKTHQKNCVMKYIFNAYCCQKQRHVCSFQTDDFINWGTESFPIHFQTPTV